jgi:hypothetical protein
MSRNPPPPRAPRRAHCNHIRVSRTPVVTHVSGANPNPFTPPPPPPPRDSSNPTIRVTLQPTTAWYCATTSYTCTHARALAYTCVCTLHACASSYVPRSDTRACPKSRVCSHMRARTCNTGSGAYTTACTPLPARTVRCAHISVCTQMLRVPYTLCYVHHPHTNMCVTPRAPTAVGMRGYIRKCARVHAMGNAPVGS